MKNIEERTVGNINNKMTRSNVCVIRVQENEED